RRRATKAPRETTSRFRLLFDQQQTGINKESVSTTSDRPIEAGVSLSGDDDDHDFVFLDGQGIVDNDDKGVH
ncbi:hypothetical protein, partial [Cycloclasticus sp.]|uniref:hypothetical protein n=1 Tax=Cycloclasticus sp. TaxID=2024830 RepID=UPI00257E2304